MDELTSDSNKRLPDFLIVGAAKSATTSLHSYLGEHPQIKMPVQKESWFFSFYNKPPNYSSPGVLNNLISDVDTYLKLFDGAGVNQILGDACPSYLYTYEDTIHNIQQLYSEEALENLKIIISLRDPVSRAFSQYYTFKRRVQEPLSFDQAIKPEVLKRRMQTEWNIFYDYTGFGLYSKQVEAFQQAFGKERVLVLLFDDLKADFQKECRAIYSFLGVDTEVTVDDRLKHNSITGEPSLKWVVAALLSRNKFKRMLSALLPKKVREIIIYIIVKPLLKRKQMDESTYKYLADFFEKDILKLEKMINRDLSNWRI